VRAFVEKDQGMYDAINRGFRRATGDVFAWLNCDEQYLRAPSRQWPPFSSKTRRSMFVFGDVVMVDAKGDYFCHRKVQTPLRYHTWTCHYQP